MLLVVICSKTSILGMHLRLEDELTSLPKRMRKKGTVNKTTCSRVGQAPVLSCALVGQLLRKQLGAIIHWEGRGMAKGRAAVESHSAMASRHQSPASTSKEMLWE